MLPGRVDVAIVGAGFGGLGLAIQMKRHGLEDFVVIERSEDVGGTWNSNTYPGAQCDIPSNLYSWSFALKHDWSRAYPERDEIHSYFRDCVEHFDVGGYIHLQTEMLDAEWRDDHWHIETSKGELDARVLVAAPGLLERAVDPRAPGPRRLRRGPRSTPPTGTTTTTSPGETWRSWAPAPRRSRWSRGSRTR